MSKKLLSCFFKPILVSCIHANEISLKKYEFSLNFNSRKKLKLNEGRNERVGQTCGDIPDSTYFTTFFMSTK